jgi:hypothetical protein
MPEALKNTTAISVSTEIIYIFGGQFKNPKYASYGVSKEPEFLISDKIY